MPPQETLNQVAPIVITAILGYGLYHYFFGKSKDSGLSIAGQYNLPKKSTNSRDFVTRAVTGNRQIILMYGSQTGTAEEFSFRISQNARRYGIKSLVVNPEDVDFEELENLKESGLENPILIMCMATYGEGDPCDNVQEMYEWVMEPDRPDDMLKGCHFAVFGCGNKTYEQYNKIGKVLDKRLEELGAERIQPLGLGDDNTNIEEDFVNWQESLWNVISTKFGFDPSKVDIEDQNIYKLIPVDQESKIYTGEPYRLGSFDNQRKPFTANKNPYLSAISTHKTPILETKKSDRDYFHIEFDMGESGIRYESGDHLAVLPKNDPEIVRQLLARLGITNEQSMEKISLEALDEDAPKKHPFPCPTTWYHAFTHYLDIMTPPKTNIIQTITTACTSETERVEMVNLGKIGEGCRYNDFVLASRRSILHILQEFPSCKPTAEMVAQILPRLQPRYYSISSSFRTSPKHISITGVEVSYTSTANHNIKGVATGQLVQQKVGDTMPMWVRRSQFKLPFRMKHPVIMIGPGTGLAPFRGFLQEREWMKTVKQKEVGRNVLFTGFRKKDHDYLYEEELETWKATGVLDELFVAFSRDQPEKVYVQHLLQQQVDLVWELLEDNAYLYICGDAKGMARDVQDVIIGIISEKRQISRSAAQDYIKTMQNKGRYCLDVWS